MQAFQNGQARLQEARELRNQTNFSKALLAYKKATKEFKEANKYADAPSTIRDILAQVYVEYGDVFNSLRQFTEAQKRYDKALKWGPENFEAMERHNTLFPSASMKDALISNPIAALALVSTLTVIPCATPFMNIKFIPKGMIPTASSSDNHYFEGSLPGFSATNDSSLRSINISLLQQTISPKNQFFTRNPIMPSVKEDLLLIDGGSPRDTRQLAHALQRNDLTSEQHEFAKHKTKPSEIVREVVALASLPDIEEEIYRELLDQIIKAIRKANLLHPSLLKGLSYVIRQANPKHLKPNDLVRVLKILNEQSKNIHSQGISEQLEMTKTLAHLLDAMSDCEVKDLNREELYMPLYYNLKQLSKNNNPELSYQASYACQALLYIPNDESPWKAFMRRGLKIIGGIAKLAGSIKNIDPSKLPEVIKDLDEGFEGIGEAIKIALDLIKELISTARQVQEGVNSFQEAFDYETRHQWYWALRYIDLLIQSHQWIGFEQFVCQVPCYRQKEFLWGLCERLGQTAANSEIDANIRKGAQEFLAHICQNEAKYLRCNSQLPWWRTSQIAPATYKFPTVLLAYIQTKQHTFNESLRRIRPIQQDDLESNKESLALLGELKTQCLADIDEFKEALDLYVKPQAKWTSTDTNSFDLETEINNFLSSTWKDALTLKDKKNLEIASCKFLKSKRREDLESVITDIFDSQDKLTSQDKANLEVAANKFLTLRSKEALKTILNKALTLEVDIPENLGETEINILGDALKEDFEAIINELLMLKNALNITMNKFLRLRSKGALKTVVNSVLASIEEFNKYLNSKKIGIDELREKDLSSQNFKYFLKIKDENFLKLKKFNINLDDIIKDILRSYLLLLRAQKVVEVGTFKNLDTNSFAESNAKKLLESESNRLLETICNDYPILKEKARNKFLKLKDKVPMNIQIQETEASEILEFNKILEIAVSEILEIAANECVKSRSKEVLEIMVNNLLTSKYKKVLLILGIGGTGKSTFSRYLARRLWEEYDKGDIAQQPIPLYITLAPLEGHINKNKDFIKAYLHEKGELSNDQTRNLQERKFVFILDGYDEIVDRERQIYHSSQLYKWKKAKIIISCRPEYLGPGYERRFWPKTEERTGFQELLLMPFTQTEIQQYVKNYVANARKKNQKLPWKADVYLQRLKEMLQQMEELMCNPILLRITLTVLPDLVKLKETKVSRGTLYERYLDMWFYRAQDRLTKIQLTSKEQKVFKKLNEIDFSGHCLQFGEELALAMYKDNNKVVVSYNPMSEKIKPGWAVFFGDTDAKYRLLRFSTPLIRYGNHYKFFHKSLRDYLIAHALWESCYSANLEKSLFNQLSIIQDPAIQQFLTERVQQIPDFETQLRLYFEDFKNGMNVRTASANAIIVITQAKMPLNGIYVPEINLNKANLIGACMHGAYLRGTKTSMREVGLSNSDLRGTDFRGADLSGADLRGADLREAILDETNLICANLSNANLEKASLSRTNLNRANLSEANMNNAKLNRANLCKANLKGADLSEADLSGANLNGADLREVNLSSANLSEAKFYNADLRGMNVHGAKNISPASYKLFEQD
ncbi:1624_t:CDS:2, partial [Cetraspora pellucida]